MWDNYPGLIFPLALLILPLLAIVVMSRDSLFSRSRDGQEWERDRRRAPGGAGT